jgi:hypothetical protein
MLKSAAQLGLFGQVTRGAIVFQALSTDSESATEASYDGIVTGCDERPRISVHWNAFLR